MQDVRAARRTRARGGGAFDCRICYGDGQYSVSEARVKNFIFACAKCRDVCDRILHFEVFGVFIRR